MQGVRQTERVTAAQKAHRREVHQDKISSSGEYVRHGPLTLNKDPQGPIPASFPAGIYGSLISTVVY